MHSYPRCARASGLRSVCPRCACLRACIVCTVHSWSLSLTFACLSPCRLRVPMRCVLELCAFVLGVWCTCAAFSQIVRHPLVNVVDIAWVRRPVLCSGAAHVCVVALASPMLALRAPVMYALAVHAFVIARLRFPCSRCVHLLCVPLLCVPALCAFVWCVVCLCRARLHRAALVDVADTTFLEDPGDLTCPSDDQTHAVTHRIALACSHAVK